MSRQDACLAMLLTNSPTQWSEQTPRFRYACPFFSIFPEAFRIIFFPSNVSFTLFIFSYPVTYRTCLVFPPLFRSRLYLAGSETLVNVQFANVEKSSRSCYFLKFPRKFFQIIILTSPILLSALSPWLMLPLLSFSFTVYFGYYLWNLIWFPPLLHYSVTSNMVEKNRVSVVFSFTNFREFVKLLFFNSFPSLLLILLKHRRYCQAF